MKSDLAGKMSKNKEETELLRAQMQTIAKVQKENRTVKKLQKNRAEDSGAKGNGFTDPITGL